MASLPLKKSHGYSLALAAWVAASLPQLSYSQDPNFHVYLAFGQSNMEGSAAAEAQDKVVKPRFKMMSAMNCNNLNRTQGSWYDAVPPLCRCNTGLTPTDYFGRTMVDSLPSTIQVGVINVAVGGCKIELFDKATAQSYVNTAPDWMKGALNDYNNDPYGRLIQVAKLAQKDGVIKGILLHQGESNVGDNQWHNKVKTVYQNILTDLSLKAEDVPLLAGEVVNADVGGTSAGANTLIAKLPGTIPTAHVISSSQVPDGPDNLHFSAAGYRELGRRYAVKMLTLIDREPVVSALPKKPSSGYSLQLKGSKESASALSLTFTLPSEGLVSIKAYGMDGKEIAEWANRSFPAGEHTLSLSQQSLPHHWANTLHLVMLRAGTITLSQKWVAQAE
jgi:lysophospholipase L1-like esterase